MPKKPGTGNPRKPQPTVRKPGGSKALGKPTTTVATAPASPTRSRRSAANRYLIKATGTTKGEVQGIRSAIKHGRMTKKDVVAEIRSGKGGVKPTRKAIKRTKRALGR